jgi:hypothetical protein
MKSVKTVGPIDAQPTVEGQTNGAMLEDARYEFESGERLEIFSLWENT